MTAPQLLQGRDTALADGLHVRRVLPHAARRAVGPFIFFDHFGPAELPAGVTGDVDGHPHIGLATVTWLFAGRMVHRDSLGTEQLIEPGAINWMTAGAGIQHSERAHPDDLSAPRPLHGLQLWVALPPAQEQMAPAFQHAAAGRIPQVQVDDAQVRVLVGEAFGQRSPIVTAGEVLYLDIALPPGGRLLLPGLAAEQALYLPEGAMTLDGVPLAPATMAVLQAGGDAGPWCLQAGEDAPVRCVLVGGAPLQQPVRLWWNYASSERDRLREAALRWQAGGFDAIPGEQARIAGPPWRD